LTPIVSPVELPDLVHLDQRKTGAWVDPPLCKRYSGNPIHTRENWTYPVNSVMNAGAVRLPAGETLLLCRAEDRRGLSQLFSAGSANGIDNWRSDSQQTPPASPRDFPEEIWGIEDPRITCFGAVDSCMGLATGSLRSTLSWLEANSSLPEGTARERNLGRGERRN
jgi:predicted GH43/DUF377 family glycosyl hydrolase